MRSEPARLDGISHLILPGSHQGEMKTFHMNTNKWASPAMLDSIFYNLYRFTFQMLVK